MLKTESRVAHYQDKTASDTAPVIETIVAWFDNISHALVSMQEEIISCMEAWTDIIPEADIRTQIGKITARKNEMAELGVELEQLRTERDAVKGSKAESESKFREREASLRERIETLEREILEREVAVTGGTISSLYSHYSDSPLSTLGSLANITVIAETEKCDRCGKEYQSSPISPISERVFVSGVVGNICPECRKKS
jgi:hypothetical protein